MDKSAHKEPSHVPGGSRARICGKERTYLFGKAIYQPGGRCGPRIQSSFQLVVLTRGSVVVTVDGVTHTLSPGEAILQYPGAQEFYRFSPDVESAHTWCEIWPKALSPADRRILRRVIGLNIAPSSVHLLIEEGLSVPTQDSATSNYAMAALARACLLRFAAHVIAQNHRRNVAPLHPALERALDIATTCYAEVHSTEDIARRVGLSASRLRALCRDAQGESPSAIIWRSKLEHAIQLIRSTGLTLGEIADDCGYANPFHLSRCVRRHTGYSPRHLREAEKTSRKHLSK